MVSKWPTMANIICTHFSVLKDSNVILVSFDKIALFISKITFELFLNVASLRTRVNNKYNFLVIGNPVENAEPQVYCDTKISNRHLSQ